jgi:hypothetical protein
MVANLEESQEDTEANELCWIFRSSPRDEERHDAGKEDGKTKNVLGSKHLSKPTARDLL